MATGIVHFFDASRLLSATGFASAGTVYFYYAGTSNLAPIFTDQALTIPAANPTTVSAGSILPSIFLSSEVKYRRRIVFEDGSVHDQDPLAAINGSVDQKSGEFVVTPFDYGAVGDKTTDDTAALVAMAAAVNQLIDISRDDYENSLTPVVWFPPCQGFRIDSLTGLGLNAGFDLRMDSPLWVSGAANAARPGFVINDARDVPNQAPRRRKMEFDVRRITQSNWTNTAAAVRLECAYAPKIELKYIEGFARGIDGAGSYVDLEVGEVYNCQEGVRWQTSLHPDPAYSFSNSVRIWGREIRCDSGSPAGLSRWGVVLVGEAPYGINTAVIAVDSYELGVGVALNGNPNGVAHPVRLEGAAANGPVANVKITGRSEGNSVEFVQLVGSVYDVDLEVLQQNSRAEPDSNLVKLTGGAHSGIVGRRATGVSQMQSIFRSGRFADNAAVSAGGSAIHIRDTEVLLNNGQWARISEGESHAFDANGYLVPFAITDKSIGVMIDLNGERGLGFSITKAAGSSVDLVVKCFDASGAVITATGAVASQYAKPVSNSRFGGSFVFQAVAPNTYLNHQDDIGFAEGVARVFIGLWAPETPGAKYDSLEIRSPLGLAQVSNGGGNALDGQLYAVSVPTVAPIGVTPRFGQRVYVNSPVVGSTQGWVFDGSAWRAMQVL